MDFNSIPHLDLLPGIIGAVINSLFWGILGFRVAKRYGGGFSGFVCGFLAGPIGLLICIAKALGTKDRPDYCESENTVHIRTRLKGSAPIQIHAKPRVFKVRLPS